jgi:hypothetical protein
MSAARAAEQEVLMRQTYRIVAGIVGLILIPLLSLVLLIISFVAEVDRGVRLAAVLLGLVALQVVLAFASFDAPVVGALHGVNAFAILGIAVLAYVRAGRPAAAGSSAPTTKSSVPA